MSSGSNGTSPYFSIFLVKKLKDALFLIPSCTCDLLIFKKKFKFHFEDFCFAVFQFLNEKTQLAMEFTQPYEFVAINCLLLLTKTRNKCDFLLNGSLTDFFLNCNVITQYLIYQKSIMI